MEANNENMNYKRRTKKICLQKCCRNENFMRAMRKATHLCRTLLNTERFSTMAWWYGVPFERTDEHFEVSGHLQGFRWAEASVRSRQRTQKWVCVSWHSTNAVCVSETHKEWTDTRHKDRIIEFDDIATLAIFKRLRSSCQASRSWCRNGGTAGRLCWSFRWSNGRWRCWRTTRRRWRSRRY